MPLYNMTLVRGFWRAKPVRKLITPFRAEEPYKEEEAPFKISTCSQFSRGRKSHFASAASAVSMGISSTNTSTRLPAP